MEKTTIYLTDELRQELERHLRRTGRRQSDVVREALGAYLADADPGLPSSIGVANDGTFDPAEDEQELARAWSDSTPDGASTEYSQADDVTDDGSANNRTGPA